MNPFKLWNEHFLDTVPEVCIGDDDIFQPEEEGNGLSLSYSTTGKSADFGLLDGRENIKKPKRDWK